MSRRLKLQATNSVASTQGLGSPWGSPGPFRGPIRVTFRIAAPPCQCMDHGGFPVTSEIAHMTYPRLLQAGCVGLGSIATSRLWYHNFGGDRVRYRVTAKSENERRGEVALSYMSALPEPKSVRERCIRVAAIVIMSKEGSRNICVWDGSKTLP